MSTWLQAGILEEMVEDTMDVMDDDELEEAADGEVEKVLYELTAGEWQFLITCVPGSLSGDAFVCQM